MYRRRLCAAGRGGTPRQAGEAQVVAPVARVVSGLRRPEGVVQPAGVGVGVGAARL